MRGCETCAVRDHAICAALDRQGREALSQMGRRVVVERGQRLIWEGDQSMVVANVIEGTLKLSISTADGREQIVGMAYPSDFIGRPFGKTSGHTVTALARSDVCVFPRTDFERMAKGHAALEHALLDRTLTELDRARGWMLLLGRKSAREKVASFLLDMARRCGGVADNPDRPSAARFTLPVNRQQIADILGTTIETVSRILSELKQGGIIRLPSRSDIEILDRDAVERMAEAC